MPRTTLTVENAPGSYAYTGEELAMAAGDVANGNDFVMTGNELIVAHNTDVGAQTITIASVADEYGRTRDITAEVIAAGKIKVFGPFKRPGWQQSTGKMHVNVSDAAVKLSIVKIPEN